MLIKEFISQSNRNKIISDLLKYYKVGSVKVKQKSMKDHAHYNVDIQLLFHIYYLYIRVYNVDIGTLELSTRYKTIKNSQFKEFLITILHEIYHAIDAKKYGWRKFKDMYEYEMNLMISQGKHEYKDNKYEIEAEEFGQKNWMKWNNKFKKDGLI